MTSLTRAWINKFKFALVGVGTAFFEQNSFWVHLPAAAIVIAVASWLQVTPLQWAALATAITLVLVAELFNTSIELIVKTVHPEHDARIGKALDVAAGAVLVTALGAVAIGIAVLGPPLWSFWTP